LTLGEANQLLEKLQGDAFTEAYEGLMAEDTM
jgi:hypothetical protein